MRRPRVDPWWRAARVMTWEDFVAAVENGTLPGDAPSLVAALWHAARGEWDRAHAIAQEDDGPDGAWVHAHLHREEGDLANASYWYRRAGRDRPGLSLEEEWRQITGALLP